MRRTRKRCLKERVELFEVNIKVLTQAGWYPKFQTPCGKIIEYALETADEPDEVIDYLDSYGIHDIDWFFVGEAYVYW